MTSKNTPQLSKEDRQDIIAYHSIYEKHVSLFTSLIKKELATHPVFGKMHRNFTKEAIKERNDQSLKLQKNAIYKNSWVPYFEYLIQEGEQYARMNIDFQSWYELLAIERNFIIPILKEEYGLGPKFLSALNGRNILMDIIMGIIGEAYLLETKNDLKKKNENLSSIFNATADAIYVLEVEKNNRFRFSSINKAFEFITGMSEDQIIGKYLRDILPPSSLKQTLQYYHEAIEEKRTVRYESNLKYTSKTTFAEIGIVPIFDDNGTCIRIVGAIYDITHIKDSEEEIKKMNDELELRVNERTSQLESVNKELEAFTYSVSHDLRAPLRAVNGYAEMMKEEYGDKLDQEAGRLLDIISANATKMGTLIDELLTFSRLGRKELNVAEVDMKQLTERVLLDINASQKHNTDIKIHNLPNVKGDYRLLYQVMYNLISNAIKYSSKKRKSKVEIYSNRDIDKFNFHIRDNGAGFNMRYSQKLFGVFQRLHSQEEFEGIGIGLSIVQRIITKHGGKVWAEGKVNKGATFSFSLPDNDLQL